MEVWTLWHGTTGSLVRSKLSLLCFGPTAILLVHLVLGPRAPQPEAMKLEIAERKRAQQALHEAKEELELRFESGQRS